MYIIDLISNPDLWNQDDLFHSVKSLMGISGKASENIKEAMVNFWHLKLEDNVSTAEVENMKQIIQDGYNFSSSEFSVLKTCMNHVFLIAVNDEDRFLVEKMGGVCGYGFPNDIMIWLTVSVPSWRKELFHTVVHEMNHVVRQQYQNPHKNFLEWMVMEGMAEVFYSEKFPEQPFAPWVTTAEARVKEFLPRLKQFWWKDVYTEVPDARKWFFGDEELKIPLWLGYATGFHLVKVVRQRYKTEPWSQFIMRATDNFEV